MKGRIGQSILIVFYLLISINHVFGQENFGIANSNYSTTNSVMLNPSSMLDSKVFLDINLIGSAFYINNDFASLKAGKTWREVVNGNVEFSDFHFKENTKNRNFYTRSILHAPSAVLSFGDHAFGFHIGGRAIADVRNIPGIWSNGIISLAENGLDSIPYQHFTDDRYQNITASGLTFAEFGLSYAHTFHRYGKDMMMAGISIKRLVGIAGGAARINNIDYLVFQDSINLPEIQAEAMFSETRGWGAGAGWAFDLGFTYQKMLEDVKYYYPNTEHGGCERRLYKYKLGVSLLDIGGVNFDDVYFAALDASNLDFDELQKFDPYKDTITAIHYYLSEDPLKVKKTDKIGLPTALSVQFDYRWIPGIYLNATYVHGFSKNRQFGIQRAKVLALTPRYESRWLEVAMPLSIYEFKQLQLGAMLRIYNVVIGTDKLLSFLSPFRKSGTDFYFNIKIPFFFNPKCNKGDARLTRMQKRRQSHCDAYK